MGKMSEGITILGKFVTKEDIEHRLISLDKRNKELERELAQVCKLVKSDYLRIEELQAENERLREKVLWPPNPTAWTVIRLSEYDKLTRTKAEIHQEAAGEIIKMAYGIFTWENRHRVAIDILVEDIKSKFGLEG